MKRVTIILVILNIILMGVLVLAFVQKMTNRGENAADISSKLVNEAGAITTPILQRQTEVIQAAEKASPAVVSISVVRRGYVRRFSPFSEDFFRPYLLYPYEEKIPFLGSGFIIDQKGHVLTNYHVIEDAEEVYVNLMDGRELRGKVLGADTINDVALLKIEGDNFPFIQVADSDSITIGQFVLAIGNPFGNLIEDPHPTVTFGVISALNRSFRPDTSRGKVYLNMIQTDAAINPGNSGGPLINLAGEAIAINTFIVSKTGASHGLGFAIPINRAMKVVREINEYGKIRSLWLDFNCINLTPYLAKLVAAPDLKGALVRAVEKGGEAEHVGIQVGDVIIKANDKKIESSSDLLAYIATLQVGDKIDFVLLRNSKEVSITYEVKEYKEPKYQL